MRRLISLRQKKRNETKIAPSGARVWERIPAAFGSMYAQQSACQNITIEIAPTPMKTGDLRMMQAQALGGSDEMLSVFIAFDSSPRHR